MSAAILCEAYVNATLLGAPFTAEPVGTTSLDWLAFLFFRRDWACLMAAHYHVDQCPCGRLVVS